MPSFLDKLLKEKPKTVPEVVAKALAGYDTLAPLVSAPASEHVGKAADANAKAKDKALESISKYLGYMKLFLFGDEEKEPKKEDAIALAEETVKTQLLSQIVIFLEFLDFEVRKDAAQVFGAVVRIKDRQDRCPGALYVQQNHHILDQLFDGYDDPPIALNCGAMLRDCLRDEALAKIMLNKDAIFRRFFDKVEVPNFEVASDAFNTFKDLLTRHKAVVSQYLIDNYATFFPMYQRLLQSKNYVTRRQSLKLLGELLLDRSNVKVMVKFVSELEYLKTIMDLLRDQSRSIQFEAFHVFKVFVANPMKPPVIAGTLANNKEKLLKFLEDFHNEKVAEDEQFKEEKAVIIKEISNLQLPSSNCAAAPPAASAAPPQ